MNLGLVSASEPLQANANAAGGALGRVCLVTGVVVSHQVVAS